MPDIPEEYRALKIGLIDTANLGQQSFYCQTEG